jgi:hypothetical protein
MSSEETCRAKPPRLQHSAATTNNRTERVWATFTQRHVCGTRSQRAIRIGVRQASRQVTGVKARVFIVVLLALGGAVAWRMRSHQPVEVASPVAPTPAARSVVRAPVKPAVEAAALPSETESERLARRKKYGDIPREKIAQVDAILRDYAELRQKAMEGRPSKISDTDTVRAVWRAMTMLDREQRADLAKVLTPRELEDWEINCTQAGRRVIASLGDLPVSDDERRAIFRLQSGFDREISAVGRLTSEEAVAYLTARQTMYERMRAVLGEQRFAFYLARDDTSYQRFTEVAKEQTQPADVAAQLWRISFEYSLRYNELAAQTKTNAAAREIQTTALRQEIISRITALVGENALRDHPVAFEWLPRTIAAAQSTPTAPR